MPGILLYCNGMKPKFKIKLQYDKKNNIWAAIAIILAVVMYVTIDFSIVALIAYGFLYYLVKSLHLELDDRCPWLWTLILFIGGSCLTTFSIQYMLLDPENFTRTTSDCLFCCADFYEQQWADLHHCPCVAAFVWICRLFCISVPRK